MIIPVAVAAVLTASLMEAPPRRIPAPGDSRGCTAAGCHDGYARQKVIHAPVESNTCDGCHEAGDDKKHTFKFIAEGAQLCLECHDEFEGKVRHQPIEQGNCIVCHDPHASAATSLLKSASIGEMCLECHDDFDDAFRYLHGPVAAGDCTACHNPHATDHASLLNTPATGLCLRCHESLQSRMIAAAHKHAPAVEKCTTCHDPHGADNKMNLKLKVTDLCLDCHDGVEEAIEDAVVPHGAMRGERSCLGCHDPHASKVARLLAADPMTLCLKCHDSDLKTAKGTLIGIGRMLSKKPNHHGPIQSRDCMTCHKEVHGGDHFRLLSAAYPARFYTPFDEARYELCFQCHDADIVLEEQDEEVTGFRNGDRNLHFLHVNRPGKGRTCRACHDVHASGGPKLIAESTPFGKWRIPINYRSTPTGGSCMPGCHKPYQYDREKPVVNLKPLAGATTRDAGSLAPANGTR